MKRVSIPLTLNGSGAGTADSDAPVWGDVAEVRYNGGTAFIGLGTVSLTRAVDGGTILAGSTGNGTWSYAPVQTTHTRALAAAGTVSDIPVDGYMRLVVTGGGASASGTIDVYVR